MKTTALILLSCFAILGPAQAQSLDASTLSLHPPAACKGAGRPAPRTRDTVHAEIAGTPASDIDVDGDGWCDWITSLPYPTNSQGQEYRAREAILLGTANGTRSFGNREYVVVMRFWQKRYCEGKSYSNQDFLNPDYKKPDHPLEVYICAPWVTEAIHRAEHDGAGIQTFLNGRDDR